MNKTKIFTLVSLVSILIVLIVFVCFEKVNESHKDVIINTHQKSDINQLETKLAKLEQENQRLSDKLDLKYNKIGNTPKSNKDKSLTKYFVCVDNTGKKYDLVFSNINDDNRPVTAVKFKFYSQSKQKANASFYWLTIKMNDADIRTFSTKISINGITGDIVPDFYFNDYVEYYFTINQVKLSDDLWHKISIIYAADFYDAYPMHNDKSNCALIPDNLAPKLF